MWLFEDEKKADAASAEREKRLNQDWSKYFTGKKINPQTVRQLVLELQEAKRPEDIVALIEQAILHGQIQPWMYEVLALNMETIGRPREQVVRVLLSSIDFIGDDADAMLILAANLSKFERYDQALKLYRNVALVDPMRVESYVMGMNLAERLQDPAAAMWSIPGVLMRAWGKDRKELHERAERLSQQIAEQLKESGRPLEAATLLQLTSAARQQDLAVTLEWNGNGDLDLEIVDPTGAVCTPRQPATPGGVLHIQAGQGPRQEDCREEAVAPYALSGEYRILVKHVSGDVVGKRARLTIVRQGGSPRESKQTQTIPLTQEGQTVRILLKHGRLAEPLAAPAAPRSARRLPAAGSRRVGQLRPGQRNMPTDDPTGFVTGVVGFQPVIQFIPDGVQLSALALVSGDRRYVRISASPLFTNITDVFTFTTTGAITGGGNF